MNKNEKSELEWWKSDEIEFIIHRKRISRNSAQEISFSGIFLWIPWIISSASSVRSLRQQKEPNTAMEFDCNNPEVNYPWRCKGSKTMRFRRWINGVSYDTLACFMRIEVLTGSKLNCNGYVHLKLIFFFIPLKEIATLRYYSPKFHDNILHKIRRSDAVLHFCWGEYFLSTWILTEWYEIKFEHMECDFQP